LAATIDYDHCPKAVVWYSGKQDMTAVVDTIPLSKDAYGVYRVGGSRVTLDLVVRAFNRGATPEEITQDFPSLQLPDVYQVIGYYLKHGSELAEYLDRRAHEEQEMFEAHQEEWSPRGLRERLLARRNTR
jgi:uncharacterized protein (DUF433 family)